MFQLEKNNEKVGAYLNKLIIAKYGKIRKFCIDYIKLSGLDSKDDSSIANMQNRMSQIIKGNKAIQTYDLPIFCELLHVSCEEILSAGKSFVPNSKHITNYEIAFSKDKAIWEKYINRDDKLILNSDEYNKTVIDYALQAKNYEFLKYLIDNKYIWFVDDSKYDCHERAFGFCAGTSIKRRAIGEQDTLGTEMQYHSEERGLRQKMIALAIENNDFEMLTSLRAREVPALYELCSYMNPKTKCKDYYNENVIEKIARASDKILEYFSEDFIIVDHSGRTHQFIYPYMDKLIKRLIENKNKYTEEILKRAIEHNNNVLKELSVIIDEAFEFSKNSFYYGDDYKSPVEDVIKAAMQYYQFDTDDGFLSYRFITTEKDFPKLCANVICIEVKSDNLRINSLIEELNRSYSAVCNIQPDISKY